MSPYLVISPVRDEQEHIETTLKSMLQQTNRPVRWIVVDDGSGDGTAEIVERYARQHDWIELLRLPKGGTRQPGSPVVRAFNAGFELGRQVKYDFVVKMDGDLRLAPTYFEELLGRFEKEPRLGIASGVYVERGHAVAMPDYHAAGACKVIRARCFEEIGGFVASRGWDTVDEIRAQALGWTTRHFTDLKFDHLRPEGSYRGAAYTNRLHGEVYYLTGGPVLFFLCKAAHRLAFGHPPVVGGINLLMGYLRPWLQRRPRLVTRQEARIYSRMLHQRIWQSIRDRLGSKRTIEGHA